MNITFYGGLNSSGFCASLVKDHYRLILDCGAPFECNPLLTTAAMRSSRAHEKVDADKAGILPEVPGLYTGDPAVSDQTICLISHLHLDHMRWIHLIDPTIPVYMSEQSKTLLEALQRLNEEPSVRGWSSFTTDQPFDFGPFHITPYFTDHPCYGSVGFCIDSDEGRIIYTGDHRYHGCFRQQAWQRIDQLSAEPVRLVIADALTDFNDPHPPVDRLIPEGKITEDEIYDQIQEILSSSNGLGIFNIYHRDAGMIRNLDRIARVSGRTAVFHPDTAYLARTIFQCPVSAWKPSKIDPSVPVISLQEIAKHPSRYLMECPYEDTPVLSHIPLADSHYFHLFGSPFLFEQDRLGTLKFILEQSHVSYHTFATLFHFNHAYLPHLLEMLRTLNPDRVVPFHVGHPERLSRYNDRVILPENKRTYTLDELLRLPAAHAH